jgi:hypothetical protein
MQQKENLKCDNVKEAKNLAEDIRGNRDLVYGMYSCNS